MVKPIVAAISEFFHNVVDFLPPGLILSLAAGCVGERKYFQAYRNELIGSILMVVFTFSAGKWLGQESVYAAWAFHAVGVVAADKFGGGQQVNPAVTLSMWCLGKCSYTEAFVRVAGQMGGGLIAFPLFHAVSEAMKWTPFGGPEFNQTGDIEAALSEFGATFLLMWAIYILNWEMNFGKFHYWIKQFLTAFAIRALIEFFPTAGPAMNPMLATAWATFGVHNNNGFPTDNRHYFVYWIAPFIAALLASVTYAIYAGERIFGNSLPIGPFKSRGGAPAKAGKQKKKN